MTGSVARMVFSAAVAAISCSSYGQIQPVTTFYAVVTADDTPLRCGDKEVLYPVARLAKGTLLRVDGQGQGWLRVVYPAGVVACVGADSVQIDPDGKTATLSKESRLKAFNITNGYKGSWNTILETALPAGTKLTLAESEPVNDGRGNAGYKIVPPEMARAYIQEGATGRATQAQIDAHLAAMAPKASENAKPADTKTASKPDPVQPDPSKAPKPDETTRTADSTKQAPKTDTPPVPVVSKSPYERLEAAFEAVRRQPPESAEYTALIGEFKSAIAKMSETGPEAGTRRRLDQRLKFLELQMDVQTAARAAAERNAQLNAEEKALADRMKDVESTRQYTIVGRLSASTIYDGKRLPLMFRIMAVGGQSSRTLAYLKPDEKFKLETKLGQVVGVLGESRMDQVLKSNVITPLRVDTLEAAGTAGNPAQTPTEQPADAPSATVPTTPGG